MTGEAPALWQSLVLPGMLPKESCRADSEPPPPPKQCLVQCLACCPGAGWLLIRLGTSEALGLDSAVQTLPFLSHPYLAAAFWHPGCSGMGGWSCGLCAAIPACCSSQPLGESGSAWPPASLAAPPMLGQALLGQILSPEADSVGRLGQAGDSLLS